MRKREILILLTLNIIIVRKLILFSPRKSTPNVNLSENSRSRFMTWDVENLLASAAALPPPTTFQRGVLWEPNLKICIQKLVALY